MLRIVGVAGRLSDGRVFSAPPPKRHDEIIRLVTAAGESAKRADCVLGFIDSDGAFVTRQTAYWIAKEAGQILPNRAGDEHPVLFSEDVW